MQADVHCIRIVHVLIKAYDIYCRIRDLDVVIVGTVYR